MTMYYTEAADAQLADAQQLLDTHVIVGATGLCQACNRPGPCPDRIRAVAIFFHGRRLPVRRPGTTRPELIGARQINRFGLLAATT